MHALLNVEFFESLFGLNRTFSLFGRIEEELGAEAKFAGENFRHPLK